MNITIDSVIHLLHNPSSGALATQSTQMPGYSFASIIPFVLDERHRPVFLTSKLAEHTKNLLVDCRASFLVSSSGEQNILAGERLSLIGDVKPVDPSSEFIARYLRYQPDAEQYLALGDFAFFQLTQRRGRYVAGFGQMGWIEELDWADCASLPLLEEVQLMHEIEPPSGRILGLDCYGFDIEHNGKRERQRFPNGPVTTDKIAEVVKRFLAAI